MRNKNAPDASRVGSREFSSEPWSWPTAATSGTPPRGCEPDGVADDEMLNSSSAEKNATKRYRSRSGHLVRSPGNEPRTAAPRPNSQNASAGNPRGIRRSVRSTGRCCSRMDSKSRQPERVDRDTSTSGATAILRPGGRVIGPPEQTRKRAV